MRCREDCLCWRCILYINTSNSSAIELWVKRSVHENWRISVLLEQPSTPVSQNGVLCESAKVLDVRDAKGRSKPIQEQPLVCGVIPKSVVKLLCEHPREPLVSRKHGAEGLCQRASEHTVGDDVDPELVSVILRHLVEV